MNSELDFEQLASQCYKERIYQEKWQVSNIDNRAEQEYTLFCCWCRAYKDNQFSEQNLKYYQQQENKNFDFWLKKRIAELFFGYKFIFDHKLDKWIRLKGVKND